MAHLFSNFAESTIADVGGIGVDATSFSVQGGHGALFPAPGAGESFYIVCIKATGEREIMKCTNVTVDTLTVVRAQEGTTALVFEAADKVSHRVTAKTLEDFMQFPDYNQAVFVSNSNGNPNVSDTEFTVTPAGVTKYTVESVGPTGSGADHIWTALNGVPVGVDWIEVSCHIVRAGEVDTGAAGSAWVYLNKTGFDVENNSWVDCIAELRWVNLIAHTQGWLTAKGVKKVPVDGRVFYAWWDGVIATNVGVTIRLLLTGYGYNS